jgi:pilus assembly protein CpaF
METKVPNTDGKGAVSIRDLVRNSLRMRPDRIIVGECRGGEALDMLQAMNTGHDGSLTTLHANTPRDALSRLETMVLMSGMDLPLKVVRQQISSAVDLIIQQTRLKDGSRKVTAITEVVGMEGETVVMTDIFRFEQTGVGENGKIIGELKPSGIRPIFTPRLEAAGFKLGAEVFMPSSSSGSSHRR